MSSRFPSTLSHKICQFIRPVTAFNALTCALLSLSHSVFMMSQASAESLLPQRPSLKAHQARLSQGANTLKERLALSRVGACTLNSSELSEQPLQYTLSLRERLQCTENTQMTSLLSHPKITESLTKSTAKNTESGSSELESHAHLIWLLSKKESDHLLAHHLSTHLSQSPYPKRSKERFKLSEGSELLRALEFGPVNSSITPSEALNTLRALSTEALGVQVRASALSALTRWGVSEDERRRAELELWTAYPQTPNAEEITLDREVSRDWLSRGEAAFKARDYKRTIEAMRHFSPLQEEIHFVSPLEERQRERDLNLSATNRAARQRSGLLIAISLMRLREYPEEAEHQLEVALSGPDRSTSVSALFYQTHLFSRLGRWDESLSKLSVYLRTGPKGRRGREARYQVGRIKHQAARYGEAIEAFKRFIATKPKDPTMYKWFLGWSYFRRNDCTGALKVWRSLRDHRNLIVGPKVRYWTARCYGLKGQKKRAIRELKALLKLSPLGYYALLAHTYLSRLEDRPFEWKNPLKKQRRKHWRLAAPSIPSKSIRRLKRSKQTRALGAQVESAFELVTLGQEGLARAKTRSLCRDKPARKQLKRRLGSKALWRLCDALEYYTGDHGARWKRQAAKRVAWKTGFHRRSARERVEAYPIAYYDLSMAAAELEEITPWWLMSHMLQESRYRPEVVSYAQAIGLLQILGRTGKRIQRIIAWPDGEFFSDSLYDPAISVRYAAWYLKNLKDDLGHTLLAIGAYNGGPMRFADHQDAFRGQPFDVMVEEMGAHESRNYLRKVADHFIRYLALYGTDEEWEKWTAALAPPELTPTAKRTVGF